MFWLDQKCSEQDVFQSSNPLSFERPRFLCFLFICFFLSASFLSACDRVLEVKGTSDASIGFSGLKNFKPRTDGTWVLEWDKIPELNLIYEIYMREIDGQTVSPPSNSSYDFSKPMATSVENFYITDVLILKKNKCFVVRVKHSAYVDSNLKEFCTGTKAVTESIGKATAPPLFTRLNLTNDATDGALNAAEVAANLSVFSLEASGFETAQYAVTLASEACESVNPYLPTAPLASVVGKTDGSTNKICVQLTNAFGESVYGASNEIVIDKTPPVALSPTLVNLGSDGKLNIATSIANLPMVTFSAESGATVSYAVAESASLCVDGLPYVSAIPTSAHAAFLNGSSRVVCVKVNDAAGNVAYNSSSVITTDTQAPLSPFVSASVLMDGILNIAENSSAGFSVEIRGEPSSTFKITCTSNCVVVSGGTVAPSGAFSNGNLNASGMATVNVRALVSGLFAFNTILSDSFGNASTASITSATAALVGPAAPTITMSALSDNAVSISENATPMAVVVSGLANAPYVLTCVLNCEVKSAASGSLSSSGLASSTIQVYADGAFELSATILDTVGNPGIGILLGMADFVPPVVSIGAPSPITITPTGSATFAITITGAVTVNLAQEHVNVSTLGGVTSCDVAVSGETTFTPSVILSNCSGAGTTAISLDPGFALDSANNGSPAVGPSPNLLVSLAAPTFTGLLLINGAIDGKINFTEASNGSAVVVLNASGFDTASYAVIDSTVSNTAEENQTSCANATYASGVPGAGSSAFGDGSTKRVCVKLVNSVGTITYGYSALVSIDKTLPTAPVIALINGAVDAKLNSSEVTSNYEVLSVTLAPGETAAYAIADHSGLCTSSLSYTSPVTRAGSPELTHGTTKVVCVKKSDDAGNAVYGSSSSIAIDTQPPVFSISLPTPAKSVVTSADSLSFTVTVTGSDAVNLNSKVSLNTSGGVNCTIALANATTSSPSPIVTLENCTGSSGTVSFSILLGAATDSAGNQSVLTGPSALLTVNNSVPNVAALSLVNGAADGKLNSGEVSAGQDVVALDATGFDTATYAIIDSTAGAASGDIEAACVAQTYSAGIPASNAAAFVHGASKRVCVKLVNNASVVAYGYSNLIEVDTTIPSAPTVNLANGAVDTLINIADVTANLEVVSVTPGAGETVTYVIANNLSACATAPGYSTTVPKASDSGFAHGSSRVVCAKLSDAAGNAAFNASSAITTETQAPVAAIITVNALSNSYVSSAENPAGGFSVVLFGEVGADFLFTCTTNCTVVSGGTVAGDALSSAGTLDVNGGAVLNVKATANGTFTFNAVLTDASDNNSVASTTNGIADLDAPSISISSPSLSTVSSSQTVIYTLTFSDTGGSGVSAAAVNIANTDVVFSGDSVGCVATVSGSGAISRSVQIAGCAAATGTVGISLASERIADAAGNLSAAVTSSPQFSVSNAPPLLTITLPVSNAVKNSLSFNLQGTCVTGLTVVVTSDDLTTVSSSATCSGGNYTLPIQLAGADGSKDLVVTSQDTVGQVSSAARTFIKDTTGPTVNIGAPSALNVRQTSSAVTYQVSFSDVNGVNSVSASPTITKVTTSGADCNVSLPAISGTGPYNVSVNNCTGDGTFKITVGANAASDSVSNSSASTTASAVINVDNTAPTAPAFTSPADGSTVTTNPATTALQGTCETGATVTLGGDVVAGQTRTCVGGNFSFSSWTLSAGNTLKSVTVTQTDLAGNVSAASVARSFNLYAIPAAPTLTAATVSGLKPILSGTCDSTADSHAATANGVGRVISVTCSSGILSVLVHLPSGGSSAFNVTATSTNGAGTSSSGAVSFIRNAFSCPSGYVGVPGSGVPGLGHASASNTHSDSWLNTSKDFCVMKYPAKDNNSSTYATSTSSGTPWVSIARGTDENTSGSAFKACYDINSGGDTGYRLISNTQWQTVVRNAESVAENWSGNAVGVGVMAKGHTDNSPANTLAHSADNDPYFGTANSGAAWNTLGTSPASGAEQRRTHILSNGEVVWDFSGNVYQWVSDNRSSLGVNPGIGSSWDQFSNITNFPLTGTGAGINRLLFAPFGFFTSAQNIGGMFGGAGVAVLRSGGFDSSLTGGLFTADLSSSVSTQNASTGFRCVNVP